MKSLLTALIISLSFKVSGAFVSSATGRTCSSRSVLASVIDEDEPFMPPDFTVEGSDDDTESDYIPPDFTIEESEPTMKTKQVIRPSEDSIEKKQKKKNDNDDPYSEKSISSRRPLRPKRKAVPNMRGTSWMEKNANFVAQPQTNAVADEPQPQQRPFRRDNNRRQSSPPPSAAAQDFRQDFRKTRVFVQGVPPGTSWQDLKDHFRVAGEVVFASVSVDMETGESKGHGIVQFQDSDMAERAIQIMRDHPLNGSPLFVREDVQENKGGASLKPKGPTPPTKWKCANEDNAEYMDEAELSSIRTLIKLRDDARRRKKYDVSDSIRDQLKESHGVFIDDRLKMWWTSVDGSKVPQPIHAIKGDGRWKLKAWRQIPTTPENDACVSAELVTGLLNQRDIARREKDFRTADALLEEARTSPDGELNLRIHDESRTWRVWTEAPPPQKRQQAEHDGGSKDPRDMRMEAAKECIRIVKEHAPEKMKEIETVLRKFEGREYMVLKRLKQQYKQ
eukprot:scaffold675_cov103-Cylindrotheca_fusiformis.AAC.8